ncbi:MAG: type II secretion system F family protein, partial [Lachnospiraceae bacterium]|nr:type II secretion system F family protein [Lachnospiraceae bacterium]
GNSLSDACRQQNLPAEIINRIRVGETSGELDKMLEQAAAGYRLG